MIYQKSGGQLASKKKIYIFAHQVNAKVISFMLCWVSTWCARLKQMTWHAHAQWIACALEMRSSNKRERPFKFINLCNGMQWIEVVFHLTILWTLSNEISNVGVIWNYSHQCRTFQNWSCHATISNISNGQHVNKHVIAVKPYHSPMFLKKKGIKKRFAIVWSTWQSKLIIARCDHKLLFKEPFRIV